MKIIGIMGAMGAGKSTAALHLVERHGFKRMSMADPVKQALRAMGVPLCLEADRALRDVPQDLLCGKSWRFVIQTFATEWGRDTIGEDLWVNLIRERLKALPADALVVFDDVRFPNEIEMLQALGGEIWLVTRDGVGALPPLWKRALQAITFGLYQAEHRSERYWRQASAAVEIENNGSPEALRCAASWALATHGGGHEPTCHEET